jgi:hypothetical protein
VRGIFNKDNNNNEMGGCIKNCDFSFDNFFIYLTISYFCFLLSFIIRLHTRIYSLGYGVALPKGSPWRDKISLAILELQEKGTIQILYDKWWKNTGEICSRDEKNKESKANALGT